MRQVPARLGADEEKLGAAAVSPRADPLPALRRGGDDRLRGARRSAPALYLISSDEHGVRRSPLVVIGFYVLALVGTYFSVGLAATADMIFRGQRGDASPTGSPSPAAASARSAAGRRSRPRSAWFWALSRTRAGSAAQIAARLLGVGWSLITFLAVPVIALEGTGPFETLKRSASMFRARWGQQITGNIAIGGAVFLFGILPAALLIVAGVAVWPSAGFVGALLVIVGVSCSRSRC